ncbi:Kelch repeat-containing protein [Actinoplanes friuliensis]|uniref:Kelch repeat-containing protein n=1 Tax=Actinoplanes friuliensis DSM 7358 TaxID=1246995 RepID=U5VZY5_9ACTN|nr:kelch repeat-containing protein [Actinoplanes friuliensis]AGZ41285.1 Kelch repeat-containing protein [Actinoplanes friuliensis DSM 7358]
MPTRNSALWAAVLMAGSVAGPAFAAPAQSRTAQQQATWNVEVPSPESRSEVGVAALNGRVYVVGGGVERAGAEPQFASDLVTSYDPRTGRWANHAPLPRELSHVGVAALNGKLYAFGGFTNVVHIDPQPLAYEFDPRRERWTRLPDLPARLGSVSVAAVDGKLHLIGGRDSRRIETIPGVPFELGFGTVRSHFVFDPGRRTWSTAPQLPAESRDHAGIAVLGHRLHVIGGRVEDVDQNLARHDVYDTRSRRWTRAATLPVPRSAGAVVVLGGRIVYAGGECGPGGETFDDVTVYNPRTDRWSTVASMPLGGRHGLGAAQVAGRAYYIAGAPTCGGGSSVDTLELELR